MRKAEVVLRLSLGLALLLSACSHEGSAPEQPAVLAAWSELGPDSIFLARAVVRGACPHLQADALDVPMSERVSVDSDFPRVCEAAVSRSVKALRLGSLSLPTFPTSIRRVVIVGDSGCRLKRGKGGEMVIQACNDPAAWPFAQVSAAAAAEKPDLVIHVGDYHYREIPCPAGHPECAGSPFGDHWDSWRTDFFSPAAPLLGAAPWIFVRGNHEDCKRAGEGWFRFLDPRPFPGQCRKRTDPYMVELPGLRLGVVDSAEADAIAPGVAAVASAPDSHDSTWLLLHRPFLAPREEDGEGSVLESALPKDLARHVALVLTGHIHRFEANHFHDLRPPEVIAGNSGSLLEEKNFSFEHNPKIDSASYRQFGYLTVEFKKPGQAKLVERDPSGLARVECELRARVGEKKPSRLRCLTP